MAIELALPLHINIMLYIFFVGAFYDTSEHKLTDHVVGYLIL